MEILCFLVVAGAPAFRISRWAGPAPGERTEVARAARMPITFSPPAEPTEAEETKAIQALEEVIPVEEPPAPVPAAEPTPPAPPRRPLTGVLVGFMEERNIFWG